MTIDSILTQLESLHAASTQGFISCGHWGESCYELQILDGQSPEDPPGLIADFTFERDALFYLKAHNHLPAVIAEVRRLQMLCNSTPTLIEVLEENTALKAEVERLQAILKVLRRYHGGDGTVTREDVIAALGESK